MKNYIVILFMVMMIPISSAYTLESTTISSPIYKCQPSAITAIFSDSAGITNVWLNLINTGNLPMRYGVPQYAQESKTMSYSGGQATYTYGNDPDIIEGYKSISFVVLESGVYTTVGSGKFIRVYSDVCTGTEKESWRNISSDKNIGGDNINEILNSGKDPLTVILNYVVIDTGLGTIIISFIIFVLCIVIYINTRNITQPLIILFATLSVFIGTDVIPSEYRTIVYLIMAVCFAGIVFRIFKKH